MKNLLLFILLLGFIAVKAQSTSETLSISGLVENPLTLKTNDLQTMKIVEGSDFKLALLAKPAKRLKLTKEFY
jgi:hypothetical protein